MFETATALLLLNVDLVFYSTTTLLSPLHMASITHKWSHWSIFLIVLILTLIWNINTCTHTHTQPRVWVLGLCGCVCLWEGLVVGLSKWMKNDWFDLKEWSDEGTDWTSLFPLVKKHSVEFQVMSSYSQHWIHSSSISWNYMIYNTFWRILGSRI